MSLRGMVLGCALLGMLVLPAAAVPKPGPKPPGPKPPLFYVGTTEAREIQRDGAPGGALIADQVTRWRVDNLKLKRERVRFLGNGWKVSYKVVAGTVTWERHWSTRANDPYCAHTNEDFKYTYSLKGRRWDVDSRITFYVNNKGRLKNRWFVQGDLGAPSPNYERPLGCPPEVPGDTEPGPPLFGGLKVGERKFAAPGQKVKMVHTVHADSPTTDGGSFFQDRRDTLRIRPG